MDFLYIHTFVSKNVIASKDVISYFLWHNVIRWNSHIYKIIYFLSFHNLLFLLSNTGEVIE